MKIKKIEVQNNPFFNNFVLDLTNNSGTIFDNIILAGENGCGKTQFLNIIYDFSLLNLQGDVNNEKRIFTIILSPDEISQINSILESRLKIAAATGLLEITFDMSKPSGNWDRIEYNFQEQIPPNAPTFKQIQSVHLTPKNEVKTIFKSIYSTVEINYIPKEASTITSKEIDEEMTISQKSGSDLATEIQQLFIDIQNNDANELLNWVNSNKNAVPPNNIVNPRINRFKNAFTKVFTNLNFHEIKTSGGKKKVIFKKSNNELEISDLSSGEKQIVFRGSFLLRNQQTLKGCPVLIDEPEISLHPIWQTKIFEYYRNLFVDASGTQTSQIFIATHSNYVLSSALIRPNDTTIITLEANTGGGITIKNITSPFVLPTTTAAELNYYAFNIPSNDYHIQLYGKLQQKIVTLNSLSYCSVKRCDDYIKAQTEYTPSIHQKNSSFGSTTYDTLPTYIRNAIDHPDTTSGFTEEELKTSIELLIKLC